VDASRQSGPSRLRGYAFGPFVVDPVKRTLWRENRVVPITGKTFDLLLALVEHRDRIVRKDELMSLVWPDTAVDENNLPRQMSFLRRALGQRPDQHDCVVTIPGHGYRFVASVRELPGSSPESGSGGDASSQEPPAPAMQRRFPAGGESLPDQPSPAVHRTDADPGSSSSPAGRRTFLWTLAVTSCGVLAMVVALAVLRDAGPAPQPRRTLQRITYDEAALPRDAAWAPDGQWVVYASDRAEHGGLWKQRPGDPDPVRIATSEANVSQPQWSPDGQSIVFHSERSGGGVYVVPVGGGVARIVSSFGYEPRWSGDGTLILFKRTVVIPNLPTFFVVGLDGKPPRPVRPDVLGQFSALHAAWHPDGRRVSIWGTTRSGEVSFLSVPLDGGGATATRVSPRVLRDLASVSAGRFVWAPSRRYIYFEGRAGDSQNVWRVTLDPSTERWIDGPERLTTGAGQESNVAISPDGTTLAFTATSSRTRLWAFPLDPASGRITGEPYPVSHGSTGEVDFDANADGTEVAYRAVRAGRNELWERSIVNGRERLVQSSTSWRFAGPRWSRDGAKLAYSRVSTRDHTLAVAVLNADGSGDRALTKPDRVEMGVSDWSRDGSAILGPCRFSQREYYSTCLVAVSGAHEAGDPSVRIIASDPKRNLYNQRFSPDQRWVTFLAHDLLSASTSTVYVMPAAGGAWRAVTDGAWFDDKPRWGPDGRVLYFVSNRSGVANVWGRGFDTSTGSPVGEPFPVTSFQSAQFQLTPQTVRMDIAVTATHLLLPMSESRSEIWMLDRVDR
jgi:Tol biopolymer transport system component/DNA-binding winged helix-turn-helix (wHTH) protein